MNEEHRLFLRALCKSSLYYMCFVCGGHLRQGGSISPITHRQLCDFSQNSKIPRKGIAMGRNLRKTTCFLRWKAIWLYLNDSEVRILLASETLPAIQLSMGWIKHQLLGNSMLRWLFWEELSGINKAWTNNKEHKWSNTEIELPRQGIYGEPTYYAMGVGAAAQGKHFTHLLISDIVGEKGLLSQTVMQTTILWTDNLSELLVNPVLDSADPSEIQFDFTHWKVGDAYEYIQDKYPDYEWRIVPALKCKDELIEHACRGHKNIVYIQHPDAGIGETNYPDVINEKDGSQFFPTSGYEKLRDSPESERIFWNQHMNMPHMAEKGQNSFKFEWLEFFRIEKRDDPRTGMPEKWFVCKDDSKEFAASQVPLYGIIDPGGFATTGLKKSSRCAALIGGQAIGSNKKFVPWSWSGRPESPSKMMDVIFAANKEWKPRCWYVETIAAQDYIYKDIREEAEHRGERLSISRTPKDESSMSESAKEKRITGLINPMFNGEIYLLDTHKNLISEITSFPGITNDEVDCLSWLNKLKWSGLIQNRFSDLNKKRYAEYLKNLNPVTGGYG